MKKVAVALALLVFPKKSSHNQQTGGVPLPFVHLGTIILSFTHKTNGFWMVLGCPRGPRRETTGVGEHHLAVRGCPTSRVSQQIPREVLGRWSISEDRKEGKREEGRLQ